MRIKRVEIIGFKSFCDRAVVNIGESITGVVGPNGCGKSNIVDAIRWCMGEQSAKHLRGRGVHRQRQRFEWNQSLSGHVQKVGGGR